MQLQINQSSVMTTAAAQIAYEKNIADLYRWSWGSGVFQRNSESAL